MPLNVFLRCLLSKTIAVGMTNFHVNVALLLSQYVRLMERQNKEEDG